MPAYTSKTKLTSVENLARVTIVNPPTRILSHNAASGAVQPGEVVEPVSASAIQTEFEVGGRVQKVAGTLDSDLVKVHHFAVAMRQIDVVNEFPNQFGPNDVVNQTINDGEFVRQVFDGTIMTTLCASAAAYTPGDLMTWDGAAVKPAGLSGTGAWVAAPSNAVAFASVVSAREVNTDDNEWLVELRLLP
jgi:hypothetical protein